MGGFSKSALLLFQDALGNMLVPQVPPLRTNQMNMKKEEWLVNGSVPGGAHFPIAVATYINGSRSRSLEKTIKRRAKKIERARARSARDKKRQARGFQGSPHTKKEKMKRGAQKRRPSGGRQSLGQGDSQKWSWCSSSAWQYWNASGSSRSEYAPDLE